MATSQNTLIGRASGSVDGVTFLTIFRKNVMRAKMSAQTNPNSTAQQAQRFKYNFQFDFYKKNKTIINLGLSNYTQKMTFWNSFQKLNAKTVFSDNGTAIPNVDISKLLISKGTIGTQPIVDLQVTGFGNPFLIWDSFNFLPYNAEPTDQAHAILMSSETGQFWYRLHPTQRQADVLQFNGGTTPSPGYSFYVWLFFVNPTSGKVSDSVFYEWVSV